MKIIVPISKARYLYELRQQMGSFTDFWSERFTGIFIGNFFYVSHHAGHEWNRRITNEVSRGVGFVTNHPEGCKVHVILTRGYLELFWLVWYYLLGLLYMMLVSRGQLLLEMTYQVHLNLALIVLVIGVISYISCWLTERGQYSMHELVRLLRDPAYVLPYNE